MTPDIHDIASGLAVLLAAVGFARSFRRKRLTLAQIAALACDHGEHAETRTMPRWKLAHEAGIRLDNDDNGKRDFSDVQLRLAVDAEAKRRGWAVHS